MCGITGWLDWERDLTEQRGALEKMAKTLAPRGPDAQGLWITPRIALAHRRLIVLDPKGGKQPMTRRRGEATYAITYNGELYNFVDLRRELETRGHAFETRGDTEVVLAAYIEWGPACVERLNGIFAFAVWDDARQELFLARDHLGVKPLFYAQRGSAVLFASELKALLASPLVPPEVDAEGLAEIIAFSSFRTPGHGIYRGVKELRAGHTALIDRRGLHLRQYWKLENREHRDDLPTTIAHVRSLLEDSVTRQLVADVPVSYLLSGGLDSSGVTAIGTAALHRAGKPQIPAFSLDFVGDAEHFQPGMLHRDRDAPWAARVSEHLGVTRHDIVLDTNDLLDNMLAPMRARDLPSAGELETSLYMLFKRIKPHATVVLSGESADEVFGGYPWYYTDVGATDGFPWSFATTASTVYGKDVLARVRPHEYMNDRYREALAEIPRDGREDAVEARRRELFYLGLTRFLSFLLDRKDRMSMAVGVEVRVPFCDHRLVDYMWNVPWEMKFTGGVEKGLLREALVGYLPDDVLRRRKTAYPTSQNPAYTAALTRTLHGILDDTSSPLRPLLDIPLARDLADRALAAPPMERLTFKFALESLIQTHHWMREYSIVLC